MARPAMVTRTMQTTKVTALCVNVETSETYEQDFILSGTYKDDKSLKKSLERVGNDDTHKVVHVKNTEVLETLYGMSEQDFIANAKKLPPRGQKN